MRVTVSLCVFQRYSSTKYLNVKNHHYTRKAALHFNGVERFFISYSQAKRW